MGIQVGDNFDHKSKKPLDARTSYSTLALMKAVTDANIYEGCMAYCAETDKYYKFLSTNTVDADTGKWREFSSGGGTDYTAGDGIEIDENNEISLTQSESGDLDEIVDDLPPVTPIDMREIVNPVPSVMPYSVFNGSNPNLLDNPWFTVNQRGASSYTTNGYCVDRWYNNGATGVAVSSNGISLTFPNNGYADFHQRVDDSVAQFLDGKDVTFSVNIDGTIYSTSFTYDYSEDGSFGTITIDTGVTFEVRNITTATTRLRPRILSNASGKTISNIRAMKLEKGTVSTLAMDTAPNYQQELAKCQRYFVRVKTNNAYGALSGVGRVGSTTDARFPIYFPTTMRTSPTITVNGNIMTHDDTDGSTNNSAITLGQNTPSAFLGNWAVIKITPTSGTFTVGHMLEIFASNDTTASFDFSADL